MNITRDAIVQGLKDLGLKDGGVVLVHSSLSSFGTVEGGARTVIDAVLECVGMNGTVMAPTLTGSEHLSKTNPPVFDVNQSKCWTGVIPETFRQYPQAIRSLHPTHSVAAIGPMADALTREHIFSITPCDDRSPYGKLAKLENGWVLLLGVDHESNTTLHHVEEIAGAAYHMQPDFVEATILANGIQRNMHLMIHQYGSPRDFNRIEPLLVERGIQKMGTIGKSTVRLVQAKRMVEIVYQCILADRNVLLKKID